MTPTRIATVLLIACIVVAWATRSIGMWLLVVALVIARLVIARVDNSSRTSSTPKLASHATVDFRTFHPEQTARLLASGHSEQELLNMLRETIRSNRQALPTYRRVQEQARYQMTVEDIEDVEQLYQQLANDSAGVFDREDYVDALVTAQATGEVISTVLLNFGSGRR